MNELFDSVTGFREIKSKLLKQEKEKSKLIIIPEKRGNFKLFNIVKENSDVFCIPDLKLYLEKNNTIPDGPVLALGFSKLESFNPELPIPEQTEIPAPILNKFDMLFVAMYND